MADSDIDKQIQLLMLQQQLTKAQPPAETIDKQKFTMDVKLMIGFVGSLCVAMYMGVTRMNTIEASMEKSSETKSQVIELIAKVSKLEAKLEKLSDKNDTLSTRMESQEYAVKAANTKIEDANKTIATLSLTRSGK